MILTKRLRQLRAHIRMTQHEVAQKLGISDQSYGHFETGNREPDIAMLNKLADLFDCSIDYLTGRVNKPYLALLDDIPPQFHQEGVHAIEMAKNLVKEGLTSDQLDGILAFVKSLNSKKP